MSLILRSKFVNSIFCPLISFLVGVACLYVGLSMPPTTSTPDPTAVPDQTYLELRDVWLKTDPSTVEIEPASDRPNVWGVVFDVGLDDGVVTLISLADGTTSLYTSSGGGYLGAGENAEIAQKSIELATVTENYLQHMNPIGDFPLPDADKAIIYALAYDGVYRADIERNGESEDLYSELMGLQDEIVQLVMSNSNQ